MTNSYLTGSKGYRAVGELGFETETLDMDGNVTQRGPVDHVSSFQDIEAVLPQFRGKIQQIPPIYSALKKGGKKLYELARNEGVKQEDIEIEPREVEIINLELGQAVELPKFEIYMECGGGTYVRSLIRDIGYKLDTYATTTVLERTKQGQFTLDDCLPKAEWSAETIYAEIAKRNRIREAEEHNQEDS